jgi:DNA adenine methylase
MNKKGHPILKWVGGKTQIIETLMANFPKEINNYHEIFLGGGSVLFALLSSNTIVVRGTIYAYDVNEPLIYVYKNIQHNHNELFDEIQKIIDEFNSCGNSNVINRKPDTIVEAKLAKENYYYWIRKLYNEKSATEKTTVIGSALFIFLNKTCFRGVFRVGPNGFNVPYGHYNNPEIINKLHLEQIHELIQDVVFECCDFKTSLNKPIEENDFIYLDPPYAPITNTSFVGYTENGFCLNDHIQLFEKIGELNHQRKRIMLSNADVELVRNHFNNNYTITPVLCKRSINSKNPESKAKELIIKNY